MPKTTEILPGEKANHIYLMPFPRMGDYDILVEVVPGEGKFEEEFSEIEKIVEELLESKNMAKQIIGNIAAEFYE